VIKLKGGVTTTNTSKNSFLDSKDEEKKDFISDFLSIDAIERYGCYGPEIVQIQKYLESIQPD